MTNLYTHNAAWDAGVAAEAASRARAVAHNRDACLADCASELAPHVANAQEALASVQSLEARIEELEPERVEADARDALRAATQAGDAEAATRAAQDLQRILSGQDQTSIERLTAEAKLAQARADLAQCRASLSKAENAALKARLAALEKDMQRAVTGYRQVAQHAFERYQLLKEISRQHMRYSAAMKSAAISVNFAMLERGPTEIVLPTVYVPGEGEVRAIGRKNGV